MQNISRKAAGGQGPLNPRQSFESHRSRFAMAAARAELGRVEKAVLGKRWTLRRSLKLDRAIAAAERGAS